MLLPGCATVEAPPLDFAPRQDVAEVTAAYMLEAMKARTIIRRLQIERDEAIEAATICDNGRRT